MVSTLVMVYLGAWLLTAVGTYVAGRLLADPDGPAENPLLVSFAAGAVWPLILLGAMEFSSVAAYSTVKSKRTPPTIPDSWLRRGPVNAGGML